MLTTMWERLCQPTTALLLLALASAAALGVALISQYVFGLQPCVLCVYQRWPLLAVAVLGAGAALLFGRQPHGTAVLVALVTALLLLLLDAGIAGYHVGVEQGWWTGTAECTGPAGQARTLAELKAQIMATPIVRCDEVAFSLFGISMAGYNLIFCLALAGYAGATIWRRRADVVVA
jgi:disulfide bond formation protein DsbB